MEKYITIKIYEEDKDEDTKYKIYVKHLPIEDIIDITNEWLECAVKKAQTELMFKDDFIQKASNELYEKIYLEAITEGIIPCGIAIHEFENYKVPEDVKSYKINYSNGAYSKKKNIVPLLLFVVGCILIYFVTRDDNDILKMMMNYLCSLK